MRQVAARVNARPNFQFRPSYHSRAIDDAFAPIGDCADPSEGVAYLEIARFRRERRERSRVAQFSKPAVSPISKSAGLSFLARGTAKCQAGFETRDIADLFSAANPSCGGEVCATRQLVSILIPLLPDQHKFLTLRTFSCTPLQ